MPMGAAHPTGLTITSATRRPPPAGGPAAGRSPAGGRCGRSRPRRRLARPSRRVGSWNGHRAAEAVNDPIFGDAERQILPALLLIVARPVATGARDELDDDRGVVHLGIGSATETGPNDAVGPPPTVGQSDVPLREGLVEGRTPGMVVAIRAEPVAQLLVRVALGLGRDRRHDEDSVDQFITISIVAVGDVVELLRRHQQAGAGRAELVPSLHP